MNGWQRLGVVLATLFAIPSGAIGYGQFETASSSVEPSAAALALEGQAQTSAIYDEARAASDDLRGCEKVGATVILPPPGMPQAFVQCSRNPISIVNEAIWYFLLPYIVVFGIGYICWWVRAGFRPRALRD